MKIKKNLEVCSDDFWYDLTDGGYLDPMEICEIIEDGKKVKAAIEIIEDFKRSCEEQIENFIQ